MVTFTFRKILLAAAILAAAGSLTVSRAQFVWNPNNNNQQTNWTTGNNWVGTAPVNNSSGTFTFADPNQKLGNNNNLTGITMTALIFSNTAGATVIGGNAVTLSGGITNNSTSLQTINLAMSTTNVRTISATSGNITIGGVISGTNGGITKDGANTLTLSGVNTYTGATTLSAGTLRATTSASALGAGTLSLGGGILELANNTGLNFARNTTVTNNTSIFSERLTAGAGVTHTLGTLSIGAQTLTIGTDATVNSGIAGLTFGATTLSASGSVFSVNTGTLLTLASVTGAGNSFTAAGAGNTTVTDAITTGVGGVTKTGTGTLLLSGANTYTGTTTIGAGVLTVTNGAAIADTADVTLSNIAGATFLVAGSETIGSLQGGGTTGGNVSIATGAALTVAATGSSTFAGLITNSGALVKSGAGTLTLSGANTYLTAAAPLSAAVS